MSDQTTTQHQEPSIRLGVSACLLGQQVRYDGGHQLDRYLVDTLGQYVEWVPVCPEVEVGLSIPRESMRLEGDPENPRLVAPKSGTDYTDRMVAWARMRAEQLADEGLHGFVFKKNSPSSGLYRVRVYNEHGMPERVGTGMFPREMQRRFPLLPMEEEGRLQRRSPARKLYRALFCLPPLDQADAREPDARRRGHFSHRAQADHDGPQPLSLPKDGPPRRPGRLDGLGRTGRRVQPHVDAGTRDRCHAWTALPTFSST